MIKILTVQWSDMYEISTSLQYILNNDIKINEVDIDYKNQATTIVLIERSYSNDNNYFTIVPDQVKFNNATKELYYNIHKKITNFDEFPLAYNFIINNCNHIKKWLKDVDEEKIIHISTNIKLEPFIFNSNSKANSKEKLSIIDYAKTLFNKDDIIITNLIVFAAIVQKFYNLSKNKVEFLTSDLLYTYKFKLTKNEKEMIYNVFNDYSILENYINQESKINFKFFNNNILLYYIDTLYRQALDLRLLNYIITNTGGGQF